MLAVSYMKWYNKEVGIPPILYFRLDQPKSQCHKHILTAKLHDDEIKHSDWFKEVA